jgi:hypothetical protein
LDLYGEGDLAIEFRVCKIAIRFLWMASFGEGSEALDEGLRKPSLALALKFLWTGKDDEARLASRAEFALI